MVKKRSKKTKGLTSKQMSTLYWEARRKKHNHKNAFEAVSLAKSLSKKKFNTKWKKKKFGKYWNLDFDGDGKINKFDCRPFNKNRQDEESDYEGMTDRELMNQFEEEVNEGSHYGSETITKKDENYEYLQKKRENESDFKNKLKWDSEDRDVTEIENMLKRGWEKEDVIDPYGKNQIDSDVAHLSTRPTGGGQRPISAWESLKGDNWKEGIKNVIKNKKINVAPTKAMPSAIPFKYKDPKEYKINKIMINNKMNESEALGELAKQKKLEMENYNAKERKKYMKRNLEPNNPYGSPSKVAMETKDWHSPWTKESKIAIGIKNAKKEVNWETKYGNKTYIPSPRGPKRDMPDMVRDYPKKRRKKKYYPISEVKTPKTYRYKDLD